jgi:methylated-DNA-[protein]-cysteine S-methyltransferase
MLQTAHINTPLGIVQIMGDEAGIQKICFMTETVEISTEIPASLQACATQIQAYFDKKRTVFDFKLNPKGTDFQQKVWADLINIPFGKTASYLTMSRRYGDEKAIRAVASANGKNPIAIVIPCHRIIGSDGSLTGYAGGLWRKKWLLDFERGEGQGSLF